MKNEAAQKINCDNNPVGSGECPGNRGLWAAICFSLVLAVVVGVRIRLLNLPLERDEGEYAYIAQLLLKGIAPYAQAYTMKLPGAPLMYALIMAVFGQTAWGIHLGLLVRARR